MLGQYHLLGGMMSWFIDRLKKNVKPVLVAGGITLLLAPAYVSAGNIKSETQECQSCHVEMSHPVVKHATLEACVSCHAGNNEGRGFVKVANRSHPEIMTSITNKAGKFAPGMYLPMTYEGTYIGSKPNEMVLIPAGGFTMGSNERLPDEGPEHQVFLTDYWLDRYEVTNLQYKQFIDATNRKSPRHYENRTFPEGLADHPVVYVSWYDANDYCEWAGKRLPTAEEWEKGARSDDARIYPWGNTFEITKANMPQRWQALKQDGSTSPVGAFKDGMSPFGLFDMSGNVWEWTSSWYEAYPGNKKPTESYGQTYKTLKGGSWWNCSFYKCGASAPAFNRSFFLRTTRNKSFGFRCAKDSGGEA